MRAIRKTDDEWASDTSEMMEQESKWVSWRKPLVVGMCAALVVAAMVVFKRMPVGLGDVAQDELIDLAADDCVDDTSNCMESKCCKFENRKCYMKNQYWATCNDTCDTKHVDAWDKKNNITAGWQCTELKKGVCAKDHEDCKGKNTCCSKDHFCFKKNEHWWNCNTDCRTAKGANSFDKGHPNDEWSCEIQELGEYDTPACKKLKESATPQDLQACCKEAVCKDRPECETKYCAFYFQPGAGNATAGNATAGNATAGNATKGNGSTANGTTGNGSTGNGTSGNGTKGNTTGNGTR